MSNANIGWLFYKEMYKLGDSDEQIAHILGEILKIKAIDERMNAKESFKLKTLYPGLLIGSGYSHGLSNNEDIKIGFYFDHTTGLPLIQGSSVKGMLRSFFGLEFGNQKDAYKKEKHEYIRDLMSNPTLDVKAFAQEIFEGIDPETSERKSIYERDIFYEARVIKIEDNISLLSQDYITPHGDNPCSEPQPLRFIKVSPEVTFEFSFDLKDGFFATANEKKKLFLDLLLMFGVGAKTNVGYGQFESIVVDKIKDITEDSQPPIKIKKTLAIIKKEIQEAKNGKSVKNKIKKESFTKEEKDELILLICNKIQISMSLEDNWFGGKISDWLTNKDLTKNQRKEIVGGQDYIDSLKILSK